MLIQGLKQNWHELQTTYQGLSLVTDTVPKKLRKTKMESELKRLEREILLVESNPYIYVYEGNGRENNEKIVKHGKFVTKLK